MSSRPNVQDKPKYKIGDMVWAKPPKDSVWFRPDGDVVCKVQGMSGDLYIVQHADIEYAQWYQSEANISIFQKPIWLPIETAPKDGTEIDLWVVGAGRVTDVHYDDKINDCFVSWSDWHHEDWYPVEGVITHWMPVPLAPI